MTAVAPICVIGGGRIGVGWTVVFADAGFPVRLYEAEEARRPAAAAEIGAVLRKLEQNELTVSGADEAMSRVSYPVTLAEAVDTAGHVQECVTESIVAKKQVFSEADRHAPSDTVIATSSSSLTASQIASDVVGRERCLLAHPANPPFVLPVVEIAAAPFTSESAMQQMIELVETAGMTPVRIRKEIEGLAYNRLQGALLREAYCLVRDGVIAPGDLDRLVTDGLGRRWSVLGPFATAHLNTRGGITAHAATMGDAYARMGAERGQYDSWTDDLVAAVAADMTRRLPLEDWDEHVNARDNALMAVNRALRRIQRLGGQEGYGARVLDGDAIA